MDLRLCDDTNIMYFSITDLFESLLLFFFGGLRALNTSSYMHILKSDEVNRKKISNFVHPLEIAGDFMSVPTMSTDRNVFCTLESVFFSEFRVQTKFEMK